MTAEFAVAVPAVLIVLAGCLGGLRIGVEQLRLTAAAAAAARSAARDDPDPRGAVRAIDPDAAIGPVTTRDDLRCVAVRSSVSLLGLAVPIAATSCALAPATP